MHAIDARSEQLITGVSCLGLGSAIWALLALNLVPKHLETAGPGETVSSTIVAVRSPDSTDAPQLEAAAREAVPDRATQAGTEKSPHALPASIPPDPSLPPTSASATADSADGDPPTTTAPVQPSLLGDPNPTPEAESPQRGNEDEHEDEDEHEHEHEHENDGQDARLNARAPANTAASAVDTSPVLPATLSIFFDLNTAMLRSEARKQLSQAWPGWRDSRASVLVVGHSDDSGGRRINRKIEARRAENVRNWLIRAGMPRHRIQTSSASDDRGRINYPSPELEAPTPARHRRVDIVSLEANEE